MSTSESATIDTWNRRYNLEERENRAKYERWLDRWLDLLSVQKGRAADLGCGPGFDTSFLLGLGLEVTAVDFSKNAVAISSAKNPSATHHVADIRDLRQVLTGRFSVIVANLSLHYFNRAETEAVFAAITDFLLPGGLFAFRLNAFDEHGAPPDRTSWELVTIDNVPKQFFDETKIRHLLGASLHLVSIEKRTTDRFGKRKSLFEVIAAKHAN